MTVGVFDLLVGADSVTLEKWTEGNPIKEKFDGLVPISIWNKANRGKYTIVEDGNEVRIFRGEVPEYLTRKEKNNPKYPYKGYVLCPECRHQLYASTSRSHTGKLHAYYHCGRCHKQYSIPLDTLHDLIKSYVSNVEFSEDTFEKIRERVLKKWEDRRSTTNQEAITADQRVLQLKQERQGLIDKIKMYSLQSVIKATEDEIETLDQKIAMAGQQAQHAELNEISSQEIINTIRYFFEHFDELLLGGSNPIKNAAMFSLLFLQTPTPKELEFRTAQLAPLFKLKQQASIPNSLSVSPLGFEPRTNSLKGYCSTVELQALMFDLIQSLPT